MLNAFLCHLSKATTINWFSLSLVDLEHFMFISSSNRWLVYFLIAQMQMHCWWCINCVHYYVKMSTLQIYNQIKMLQSVTAYLFCSTFLFLNRAKIAITLASQLFIFSFWVPHNVYKRKVFIACLFICCNFLDDCAFTYFVAKELIR